MSVSFIPFQLPKSLYYIVQYIIYNNISIGLFLFFISIVMIFFSKYFKWLFLLLFILFEIYLLITLNIYFPDKKFVLTGFLSSLIFLPFLYLALKGGYSITILNIIFLSLLIIFYPEFQNVSIYIFSIISIFLFVFSVVLFIILLKIKRKIFLPRGEYI